MREIDTQSLSVCRFRAYSKNPARLAHHADREQRQERRVEEDEHGPEVDLAERLVQLDPHHLWAASSSTPPMKAKMSPPMIV